MWFDLSEHQGPINFDLFSKIVGLEGCIIRVQSGYSHPDPRYKEYVAGCKQYNIPFGTYAYGKYVSINDAIAEADSAFNLTDPASQFIIVDIEENCCKNKADLVPATQAYIDRLHAKGIKKVGKYSYVSFYNTWHLDQVRADFIWMADYDANDGQPHTPPTVPCDIWQYSSQYHADGITQNTVDISKLMGTKPDDYFGGLPQYVGITTGGYAGEMLGIFHKFILEQGWYYEVEKKSDNTLMFWVGGFLREEQRVLDFKKFLTEKGWWFVERPIDKKF